MRLFQLWTSLQNQGYESVTLILFGKLFHTRAAFDLNDLSPYLVVFTLENSAFLSALKLQVKDLFLQVIHMFIVQVTCL